MLEALKEYGLDLSCLRGQCYDGAGNMAACKVQLVKNMMGTMVEICLFFSNSPKRQSELPV